MKEVKKEIKQPYIVAKEANKITYTIASFAALSFWLALYIFGYYFAYKDTKFDDKVTEGGDKDYSISFSIANGSEPGITVFFTIGIILLISLLFLRFQTKKIYFGICLALAVIVYGLFISMIYYSPFKQNEKYRSSTDEHGIVAIIAFTSELVFNILIYIFMINNYRKSMPYLILLIIIEVAFFISLFADAYYEYKTMSTNKSFGTYFAVAENINYNFVVISILLLGFL